MGSHTVTRVTRRRFLQLSALTATGAIIAACAGAAPTAAPTTGGETPGATTATGRKGGTMVTGYAQKTSYSDLLASEFNAGVSNYYLRTFAFNSLIGLSSDYTQWLPELAESWEFDGNKAIFHLRQDVKWHDGEPFTSADVLFTFGRLVPHPNVGRWNGVNTIKDYVVGMNEFSLGEADEVTGVSAPDDYTFIFEMPKPYRGAFLEALNNFVIMPEHHLGQIPEEQWQIDEQGQQGLKKTQYAKELGIGTGPYRVTNYVADQMVEYEPFDDYFMGRPQLDKLVFIPYTDRLAMAAAAESGECHIAIRAPESELERFRAMTNLNVVLNPGPMAFAFYHNIRYALADKRVRQALSLALDREKIAQDIYFGAVSGAQANLWYGSYGNSPNIAPYYEYNPERARELLEEGGWDPDYTLRLMVQTLTPESEPFYAMVRDMLDAVGIKTEMQITGAEYTNVLTNDPWDFDTIYSGYGWGFTPAGYAGNFRDPRFGPEDPVGLAMIDEINLMEDEEEIQQAIWRLQEYVADDPRHLVTCQVPGVHLVSTRVQGSDVKPLYGPRNRWIDMVNVYMSA